MRFYFNEASIQGQFDDVQHFRTLLEAVLAARIRSPFLAAMRTTPMLADRPVTYEYTVRQVIQTWRGSPVARTFLAWIGHNGPFIDDDRLAEAEDLFQCFDIEVTDGGLGEAARRIKANEAASAVSFPGGKPDFARTPLPVIHGFSDAPIATYEICNFWSAEAALKAAFAIESPTTSWQETIEVARRRFLNVVLPDTLHQNARLARDPFDGAIRDRIYALLGILDNYMDDRNEKGAEGTIAQEIIRKYFQGNRALFSPESNSNQRDFKKELTFPDPQGGQEIFAHWHGKISHRTYRIHFEWPVPANARRLKVVYIGPKITKQ